MDEYLRRIGATRPGAADLAGLRELHRRHVLSVPFENLSTYLGEPVDIGEDALFDKIVRRRRGGQCYELNGAFAVLLRELGFDVTQLGGRVLSTEGVLGPALDHLALRVRLEEDWLVDVGFGRFSMQPLRLHADAPQDDPAGRFLLRPAPHGDIEVLHNDLLIYRLETRARDLDEFRGMAWWHSTSPHSAFTRGPMCSLATSGGRTTLTGRRLITTVGTNRDEIALESDQAVLAAYHDHFGITLDRVPAALPQPQERTPA